MLRDPKSTMIGLAVCLLLRTSLVFITPLSLNARALNTFTLNSQFPALSYVYPKSPRLLVVCRGGVDPRDPEKSEVVPFHCGGTSAIFVEK